MSIYLFNIFVTFIFGVIVTNNSGSKFLNGRTQVNGKKFMGAFFILLSWVLVYSLRGSVGSDTLLYRSSYESIGWFGQSLDEFVGQQRDILFSYIQYFSYKIFDGSWSGFLSVSALLTYVPVIAVLAKRSSYFLTSVLLFIFTLNFYFGFNGMRQAIAISITFYAYYELLKEKKYIKYFFAIALAFGFHSTAVFVLPFHFLSLKPLKSLTIKITTAGLLFSFVFLWNVWDLLIVFFDNIGQSKLASDYANVVANGSGLLRVFVFILPIIIGYIYHNQISDKYGSIDSELILMGIAAIFMLFSTKYWIFSRIALYFSIVTILFVPKLEVIFDDNSKRLGMFIILVLYFAYMIILLLYGEGGYYPYTFVS